MRTSSPIVPLNPSLRTDLQATMLAANMILAELNLQVPRFEIVSATGSHEGWRVEFNWPCGRNTVVLKDLSSEAYDQVSYRIVIQMSVDRDFRRSERTNEKIQEIINLFVKYRHDHGFMPAFTRAIANLRAFMAEPDDNES